MVYKFRDNAVPQRTATLAFARERLRALERRHLLRHTRPLGSGAEPWAELNVRRVLNLSSNNYLGLAGHPLVRTAAAHAAESEGTGAGASRLIAGTGGPHEELEARLARFKGSEAALLFNSGYAANLAAIPALIGPGDVALGDELNHASIIDGCRLSRADYETYPHRDVEALAEALRGLDQSGHRGRRLVLTDTVFSMDGDIAPLPDIVDVCDRYGAILYVDEAHATGCLGPGGRGALAAFGLEGRAPVAMSTLSKAFGSFGAFISGETLLRDYLVNTARGFIYTTALPPAVVAASLAALDALEREPERVERLQENGRLLREGLQRLGFDTSSSETQIVPVLVGESATALEFAGRLVERGVFAVAVRPPTVPLGRARIRASVMATHTRADIELALTAFGEVGRELGLIDA